MQIPTLPHSKITPKWRQYPWSRFSADEFPRENPLPRCPDPKCRRAKACLSAHKGLFCQRTHFTIREGKIRTPKTETGKYIDAITMPPTGAGLDLHMTYIKEISGLRKVEQKQMEKIWRAGGYDKAFGPYTAKGFMRGPPAKHYVEE